jgi:predicted nuclease of predicted toxin-antitoxin system
LRFKVDENLPIEVAGLLGAAGHDAQTVPEEQLAGHADPAVADVCRQEGRALVTLDLDFADIRAYPPADYPGIVVMRLSRVDKAHVLRVVRGQIPLLTQEALAGTLWIAGESKVRIRS